MDSQNPRLMRHLAPMKSTAAAEFQRRQRAEDAAGVHHVNLQSQPAMNVVWRLG